jgi:hypothetical protein
MRRRHVLEIAQHECVPIEIRQARDGVACLSAKIWRSMRSSACDTISNSAGVAVCCPSASNRGRYASSDSAGRRAEARRCIRAAFVAMR